MRHHEAGLLAGPRAVVETRMPRDLDGVPECCARVGHDFEAHCLVVHAARPVAVAERHAVDGHHDRCIGVTHPGVHRIADAVGVIGIAAQAVRPVERIEQAQRQMDYGRASELQYGKLVTLNQQLEAAEAELGEMQGRGMLLKEEVGAEEVAEVVATWTHIPVSKLLEGEIRTRHRKNIVQARSFAELLEASIRKYQNRAIETAQVIEELIRLAREMREAARRGEELGLTEDEVAFYDALEVNDSAVSVLGDETLRLIAQELVKSVRSSITIDWTVRENVRAQMRVIIKRILRKYGYPPDRQARATDLVLEQAEVLCKDWSNAGA